MPASVGMNFHSVLLPLSALTCELHPNTVAAIACVPGFVFNSGLLVARLDVFTGGSGGTNPQVPGAGPGGTRATWGVTVIGALADGTFRALFCFGGHVTLCKQHMVLL